LVLPIAEIGTGPVPPPAVVCGIDRNAPGSGFFKLARALGLYQGRDDDRFWLEELKGVNDYWSEH
jgi:hypothetical protein